MGAVHAGQKPRSDHLQGSGARNREKSRQNMMDAMSADWILPNDPVHVIIIVITFAIGVQIMSL